ncbi:beta-glucuronidase, partial [Xanthomonas citri pv. citri]|nr:beta-glucuronidase [Xanthomonas citri pv. citri]
GGHLPIMADVTDVLTFGSKNLLTVAVNNTLTPDTIPQGDAVFHDDESKYPPGYYVQEYDFDFFNYAGIHRPVFLYTTSTTFVE